jgi:peptide-methionine (S)-S-oxide reductase
MAQKIETAIFGGGCFWCTEAVFEQLQGVTAVMPGYAGGSKQNPSYEQVSSGSTGHAEVIQVQYDPSIIQYADLLNVFFSTHDPTTMNRQGNDVGEQYRSTILYTTPEQKAEAEKFIADLNAGDFKGTPIVTKVEALDMFYPAEEYHRQYYRNNPNQGYCQVIIDPKITKFKKKFQHLLKK